MKTLQVILQFLKDYQDVIVLFLQLVPVPFIVKLALKALTKFKKIDDLEITIVDTVAYLNREFEKFKKEEFEKFKTEVREKFKEQERLTEEGLDQLTQDQLTMERRMAGENKAFTDTLHNLNLTLMEFKTTVGNLNENLNLTRLQSEKMFDRVLKEFAEHKTEIREELKDLKHYKK
jgi:hypothetical protein